jgi:hypothetical protein
MKVHLLVFLLVAAPASALELADLFDPARGEFALSPIAPGPFARLSAEKRLCARGISPRLYVKPPVYDDSVQSHNPIPGKLFKGFTYGQRLAEKQRAFRRLAHGVPVEELAQLLTRLRSWGAAGFLGSFGHLLEGTDLRRRLPSQPLQALRHSERQFVSWFLLELAARINEASSRERDAALSVLLGELSHRDADRRRRAARVLGLVRSRRALRALERRVAVERDGAVAGELVHACALRGGTRMPEQFARWLRHPLEAVRLAAVRECRAFTGPWVGELLSEALAGARGRLRDEIGALLARRSGIDAPAEGPVDFYGIRTFSRRILICIDFSRSMLFPMDGAAGELEARLERTRRELARTLSDLPSSVSFNVALFSDGVIPFRSRLVQGTSGQREAALAFLEGRRVIGGTNIFAALDFALSSGADTVFLLTDGEASVGAIVDPALILAEFSARNRFGRIVLHTIGLSRDQQTELLCNLAHLGSGRYVAVR